MSDWRETLEMERQCHTALQDSPVAHARVAEAIDAALAQIDALIAQLAQCRRDYDARIAQAVLAGMAWKKKAMDRRLHLDVRVAELAALAEEYDTVVAAKIRALTDAV